MEEDTEQLDWGNEDDESQAQASYSSHYSQRNSVANDAEDAVSLGGDDDDLQEFSAYQSRSAQNAEQYPPSRSSRPPPSPQRQQTPPPRHREHSGSPHKSSRRNDSPSIIRSQPLSMVKLTHALPPKPVLASVVVARSPPLATTLASSMVPRDKRSNGQSRGKSVSVEASDGLPPDWEIRYPRSGGREAYYYNVRTHESTWTRPQASVRVASPAKDRDSRTRSLSRSVDDGARSQVLPRTASRKDTKRRASPVPAVTNALTYEDRHYRPVDSSANTLTDRASRPQARPVSPVRSVTPPPRRESRTRRDLSRSPSPLNDSWRPNTRDEDRSWARSRNDDTRSLSQDTRPRGRRQRADLEPPLIQDEPIRRDHSREWPAHRHRSPPREVSPPISIPRRGMDSWRPSSPTSQITSKRKTRNDQFPTLEGPKLSTRRGNDSYAPRDDEVFIPREDVASETRKRESYVPADSIPQRRGREQDYGEIEVKRRRTEVDYSPPLRRAVLLEPEVLPTSNSLPQPPATAQDAEVPRRKRQPLPPQSARFKEASKLPPPPVAPAQNTPPVRPAQDGRIPNGPSGMYAAVPSGPRNQNKGLQGDMAARTSKSFSRFDPPAAPARPDPNAMDIDYPPPSKLQAQRRRDEGIPRSASATHLNDMQLDSIPKGPRAMAAKLAAPPASYPSQPAKQDMARSPANTRGGKLPRQPPPHMAQPREALSRRESAPGASAATSQRFEDSRDSVPTGPAKRRLSETRETAPPPADTRGPRRNAGPPTAPSMKLSGTNNIPIGTRRLTPVNQVPEPSSPSGDRLRSAPSGHSQRLEPNTRYSDNYNSPAQESLSDDRHYRPPPERRHQSNFERETPNSYSRTQREIQEVSANSRRQRRDSLVGQDDRAGRQTRFGPEPGEPESRMWLTRDESQEMANRMGHSTSRVPSQSSTRETSSAPLWNPSGYDDSYPHDDRPSPARSFENVDYYRRSRREPSPDNIYPPPEKRHPGHQSLELRLSTATREFSDRAEYRPPRGSKGKEVDNVYMDSDPSRRNSPLPPSQDIDRRWDSYAPEPPMAVPVHPERAALLESQHPLPPRPDTSKRSVRIRRQQPSPRQARESDIGYLDASLDVNGSPQRPSARRGVSLLDRLQLDNSSGPSTDPTNSLRDRVDMSSKDPDQPVSGSQRTLVVAVNDGEGPEGVDSDIKPKGGRGKKRSGKPRRGRRGGPA